MTEYNRIFAFEKRLSKIYGVDGIEKNCFSSEKRHC